MRGNVTQASFHIAGTNGQRKHSEFIKWVNANNVRIINSYVSKRDMYPDSTPWEVHYVYVTPPKKKRWLLGKIIAWFREHKKIW